MSTDIDSQFDAEEPLLEDRHNGSDYSNLVDQQQLSNEVANPFAQYTQEYFAHAMQLATNEFQRDAIEKVKEAPLSMQLKQIIITKILAFFGKTAVLSNTRDMEQLLDDLEKNFNKMKVAAVKPDINATYVTLLDTLRLNFKMYISRSERGEERKMQGKMVTSSEFSQTIKHESKTAPPSRGISLPGIGKIGGGNRS